VGVTRTVTLAAQNEGAAPSGPSQEGTYWEKHDGSADPYRTGQPQSQPQQIQPTTPTIPQNQPGVDNPQRQVEMTGLPQNSDSYDGMGVESGATASGSSAMSRIAPEQLPGLLNASSSSTLNA